MGHVPLGVFFKTTTQEVQEGTKELANSNVQSPVAARFNSMKILGSVITQRTSPPGD